MLGKTVKPTKGAPTPGDAQPTKVERGRNFLQETLVELKPPKTKWPTYKEAWRLTVVVLVVILIVAIYVALIDGILTQITLRFNLFGK
jgi:preprotein translocase SecE subunit